MASRKKKKPNGTGIVPYQGEDSHAAEVVDDAGIPLRKSARESRIEALRRERYRRALNRLILVLHLDGVPVYGALPPLVYRAWKRRLITTRQARLFCPSITNGTSRS